MTKRRMSVRRRKREKEVEEGERAVEGIKGKGNENESRSVRRNCAKNNKRIQLSKQTKASFLC